MAVVIEQRVRTAGSPAAVFAYLHDPGQRADWDVSSDAATLEPDTPGVGARLQLRGHRTAPSWVGEYTVYEPPRRSSLRLVDGAGMPFTSFVQSLSVTRDGSGSMVEIRLEYEPRGVVRLIEPLTLRSRLRKVTLRSLAKIRERFG
ncbi:MAG: Polyketide cyclase / dehydrase and lipid transport [Gaiellales bacterium]|jgi:uncharacterized protein YndB with AHSA1/START domain|nr:Polyketide cyclase / dehydrase and lipid transport [Gaiellales bacterium]